MSFGVLRPHLERFQQQRSFSRETKVRKKAECKIPTCTQDLENKRNQIEDEG